MKSRSLPPNLLLAAVLALSCSPAPHAAQPAPAAVLEAAPSASSAIDLAGIDRSVAPGDDFFAWANGSWMKSAEIPADRSSWGVGGILTELTAKRTADLIAEAAKSNAPAGSEARKIGDTYCDVPGRGGHRGEGPVSAPARPRQNRRDRQRRGSRARARGDAPRRRRRVQQHGLLHRQRPRPLGRAGPGRADPLRAVPAAGRARACPTGTTTSTRRRGWPRSGPATGTTSRPS